MSRERNGRDVRIAAALMPSEEVFPRELGATFLSPTISHSEWKHETGHERHNGVVSR